MGALGLRMLVGGNNPINNWLGEVVVSRPECANWNNGDFVFSVYGNGITRSVFQIRVYVGVDTKNTAYTMPIKDTVVITQKHFSSGIQPHHHEYN
jgi:hypothetical protein